MFRIAAFLVTLVAGAGAAAAQTAYPQPDDIQRYYIYFLNKGPAYGQGTDEKQKDIQDRHMAHLGSLGAKIAGPFGTDGPRRGLVILQAPSIAEARAKAEADPAVQAGSLTVEIYTLAVPGNWFRFGPVPEPYSMARFVFVLFETAPGRPSASDTEMAALTDGHLANLFRLSQEGKLDLAGPLLDGGARRGIGVLRTDSADEALAWLAEDPLVKSGHLTITPLRWFAADGIMLKAAGR